MTAIRVTTLDNGLRVATDPMATVETTSLGVWIDTGARDETATNNGVSHFLEHMVFKGTPRRDARAIAEEIEAVGGHLNAHTAREYTAYYAKVLKEDALLALDIVADLVQNAVLDPEELERERAVIVQEIMQALDTPDDVVFERFQETAFPQQSLGRSVLGTAELIRAMPRETLLDYRNAQYRADRMVVSAAGRIDHDRFVEAVKEAFRNLPSGSAVGGRPAASYVGGDWRENRDLEQVQLLMGFEGVSFRHQDFFAVSLLSTVLGGGMSSRLFQEVREKRGLVYSIYTFPSSFLDCGLFGIYAGTGETAAAEVIPLICDELRRIAVDLEETELARARAQLKSNILMGLESSAARCDQLARQLLVFGRPLSVGEIVGNIESTDATAVRASAERLFASPVTCAALGPVDQVPSVQDVAARLAA